MIRFRHCLTFASAIAWLGCATPIAENIPSTLPSGAVVVAHADVARCIHGVPGPDSPYREALAEAETDPALLEYLRPLDPSVRRTAVAAGLEPLIARTLRAQRESGDVPTVAYLELRQRLSEQVAQLQVQLNATELEVDCIRSLLLVALNEYSESETDRQLNYTIASLVAGSVTGVGGAAWDIANSRARDPWAPEGPLWASIVGVVSTGLLGAAVLFPQEQPIVFRHERNLLKPLLFDEDPDFVYPTFIFRLLTLPAVGGGASPRDELIDTWSQMLERELEGDELTTSASILYGNGGIYDPDLAALHQEMLQRLGGTLDALSRDLDLFNRALSQALASTTRP